VVERDSYDAWGKRRFPNGADDPSGSLTSQTTRGFTGQEELTDVGLVHLNGRVYDPLVGRMMSADPFVPDPMNGQAWNRYSYVINNPLALTDTNGYCFLGMCTWGKAISTFFGRTFGVLFRDMPILGTLFEIAAVALCMPLGGGVPCMAAAAGLSTTFVAGVTSGNLGYALKAGLIAALTQIANFGVGWLGQSVGGMDGYLLGAAGHALVGCASAIASRGKCGPAALAGGISSLAGPWANSYGRIAGLVISSVVGGLASVAGGGKFANGAITGAFAYLTSPQPGSRQPAVAQDDEEGDAYGQAGGGYPTRDAAAIAALQMANPMSIRDAVEYGGVIYRLPSGGYDFTLPIAGGVEGVDLGPVLQNMGMAGADVVGMYHTHGDFVFPLGSLETGYWTFTHAAPSSPYYGDNFSFNPDPRTGTYSGDIPMAMSWAFIYPGFVSYLATPSWQFKVYDPATNTITRLR
jgi:RHS repeat-associated protein